MMNRNIILGLTMALVLMAGTALGQKRKKKAAVDSLSAYREFVALGKWYLNMPLQIKLQFITTATPAASGQSSRETDMLLYYGQHDFYLQADGMEQIVNDSLTVLVNRDAKMIKLVANPLPLANTMQSRVLTAMPDTSLQRLAGLYAIDIQEVGREQRRILVQSRGTVSGTAFAKEAITITYLQGSQQPVDYVRVKRSLIPVDPATYTKMEADGAYAQRLVRIKGEGSDLFFVVKEETTECRFVEVSIDKPLPPASQRDRIVKNENGEYTGAKGFEEYVVDF